MNDWNWHYSRDDTAFRLQEKARGVEVDILDISSNEALGYVFQTVYSNGGVVDRSVLETPENGAADMDQVNAFLDITQVYLDLPTEPVRLGDSWGREGADGIITLASIRQQDGSRTARVTWKWDEMKGAGSGVLGEKVDGWCEIDLTRSRMVEWHAKTIVKRHVDHHDPEITRKAVQITTDTLSVGWDYDE